jgi:hypothetical protein
MQNHGTLHKALAQHSILEGNLWSEKRSSFGQKRSVHCGKTDDNVLR